MIRPLGPARGFTLIEMIVTIAVAGILLATAGLTLLPLVRSWQVRTAANQVYDDLGRAQSLAMRTGEYTLAGGQFQQNRVFVAFNGAANSYAAFTCTDANNNGNFNDAGECTQAFSGTLPSNVAFGVGSGVNKTACNNAGAAPAQNITYAPIAGAPCNGSPCLRMNKLGFSEAGGGQIYLTRSGKSYAVSGTRPGNFSVCSWNGSSWQ
ncbi:hypothetical protein DESUT3_17160 [Desulfuromonas versatilis]|uniref:Prepilin-type N-terminal cleavage/methylation domain-containing protein n=1 Tax=Desulfuromonas versatilis TaxID=2802975 RepID=A0ABN6DXA1_9BACT|nr:prepilin-type N-terminal cleavage/methylation domain-containing protein [Desulfuromonas versatilis]BCR04647.1 hypothetical protein DESUT3_17160 [Desulfuromonas versatilis]